MLLICCQFLLEDAELLELQLNFLRPGVRSRFCQAVVVISFRSVHAGKHSRLRDLPAPGTFPIDGVLFRLTVVIQAGFDAGKQGVHIRRVGVQSRQLHRERGHVVH